MEKARFPQVFRDFVLIFPIFVRFFPVLRLFSALEA
jgi:hypothetical protein